MKHYLYVTLLGLFLFPAIADASGDVVPFTGLTHIDEGSAALIGVEYRHEDIYEGLRPAAGLLIDEDSGLYGYAGAYWEFEVADNIFLSPTFAVGLYSQGNSEDMGGAVEFRSGLEAAYAFEDFRIGLSYLHLSNAGLYDKNPGTEMALLSVQIPLGD